MNKIELAIAIDQIGRGFHLTDWESEDDLDKAFRETMDIICDYDEEGIKAIIEGIKQAVNEAMEEELYDDPEFDGTFALCETAIAELEELLDNCCPSRDEETTKCEVIKSIMNNSDLDDSAKIWKIQMYLKGWLTKEQATRR